QQQPQVVAVVARARVPRRADAGLAAERVDDDPGVVGERGEPGVLVRRPCLEQRVRLEAVAVLDRLRPVVADELVRSEPVAEDAPQLLVLVRVVGREHEGRHGTPYDASAADWMAASSPAPATARSSSESSSPRSNGAFSAVPCTSMKSPRPVTTTFMSVSARRSSV